jgi:hypothetical protein
MMRGWSAERAEKFPKGDPAALKGQPNPARILEVA